MLHVLKDRKLKSNCFTMLPNKIYVNNRAKLFIDCIKFCIYIGFCQIMLFRERVNICSSILVVTETEKETEIEAYTKKRNRSGEWACRS